MGSLDASGGRRGEKSGDETPKLEFGFRGEGVICTLGGRRVEVASSWHNGERLYPGTMRAWSDGQPLADDEALSVFRQVVSFVAQQHEKPVVVLNRDDPRLALWERGCAEVADGIVRVDYTSDAERDENLRQMFLGALQAGKRLHADGVEITNEEQVDDFVRRLHEHGTE